MQKGGGKIHYDQAILLDNLQTTHMNLEKSLESSYLYNSLILAFALKYSIEQFLYTASN